MIEIRETSAGPLNMPPGTWRMAKLDGKPVPKLSCPECSLEGWLDLHEVNAKGDVIPSVICMGVDCAFHEFVRLVGWKP